MAKVKDDFDATANHLLDWLAQKLNNKNAKLICISNPPHPDSEFFYQEYASPEWLHEKRMELGDMGGTHPGFRTRVMGEFAQAKPVLCRSCSKELDQERHGASNRLSKFYKDAAPYSECTRCNPQGGE